MKLTFLGTRGQIEPKDRRHRMHTSLLVTYRRRRVRIDAGLDWLGRVGEGNPGAVILTHAHPDHAFGLQEGAPCPVWATKESWEAIHDYPIPEGERHTVVPRSPVEIEGITFEAFPVEHSTRAPAVGYRIGAGRVAAFYAPDVAWIPDRHRALRGARVYVGDGATMERSMAPGGGGDRRPRTGPDPAHLVRRGGGAPGHHHPLRCRDRGGGRAAAGRDAAGLGRGEGVEAEFAHDGMEVVLR